MGPIKIKDLDHLKELCRDGESFFECFIALNLGIRSSKRIHYDSHTKLWAVHEEVDDSWLEGMQDYDLKEKTNIVSALEVGALYYYSNDT